MMILATRDDAEDASHFALSIISLGAEIGIDHAAHYDVSVHATAVAPVSAPPYCCRFDACEGELHQAGPSNDNSAFPFESRMCPIPSIIRVQRASFPASARQSALVAPPEPSKAAAAHPAFVLFICNRTT